MGRSAERSAKNEARFREANERIEASAVQLAPSGEASPYLCECDEERCTTIIRLTLAEYEAVRSKPRQFFIAPGHQSAADRVLEEHELYTLIEKTGEEGRIVE